FGNHRQTHTREKSQAPLEPPIINQKVRFDSKLDLREKDNGRERSANQLATYLRSKTDHAEDAKPPDTFGAILLAVELEFALGQYQSIQFFFRNQNHISLAAFRPL